MVLYSNVAPKDIAHRRPIAVVNREDGAMPMDTENVTVLKRDVSDVLGLSS